MEFEIPAVVPNFKLNEYQTTTPVYPNIEFESYAEKKIKEEKIHN